MESTGKWIFLQTSCSCRFTSAPSSHPLGMFLPHLLHPLDCLSPSPLHPFTPSLLLSFSRSLVLSFSRSLVLSFSRSLVLSFSRSLLLSFSPSLLLSFSPSLLLSFSPSVLSSYTQLFSNVYNQEPDHSISFYLSYSMIQFSRKTSLAHTISRLPHSSHSCNLPWCPR